MAHDPNQILMGSVNSSDSACELIDADPSTFPAGLALRLNSSGAPSIDATDGEFFGVSRGESLSKTKKLAVQRYGCGVPLKLTEGFVPVVGEPVFIDDETGLANAEPEGEDDWTVSATAAIYKSGPLDAILLDGTVEEDSVCYIDMPGGL